MGIDEQIWNQLKPLAGRLNVVRELRFNEFLPVRIGPMTTAVERLQSPEPDNCSDHVR